MKKFITPVIATIIYKGRNLDHIPNVTEVEYQTNSIIIHTLRGGVVVLSLYNLFRVDFEIPK